MRHLLRSLILAIVLIPALTAAPPARALTTSRSLEACVDGNGTCSVTGDQCATSGECLPRPQTCICN